MTSPETRETVARIGVKLSKNNRVYIYFSGALFEIERVENSISRVQRVTAKGHSENSSDVQNVVLDRDPILKWSDSKRKDPGMTHDPSDSSSLFDVALGFPSVDSTID